VGNHYIDEYLLIVSCVSQNKRAGMGFPLRFVLVECGEFHPFALAVGPSPIEVVQCLIPFYPGSNCVFPSRIFSQRICFANLLPLQPGSRLERCVFNRYIRTKKTIRSHSGYFHKPLLRDGFRNGMANQAGHLAGLLNSRLIFFMLPASVLGIYSNALSLAEATMMIPGSMGQVMYASLLNEKDPHKSSATAKLTWWVTLLLLIIVFVIVLLIPDLFYQLIFGHAFAGVKHFLSYLSAAMIFYGSYLVISYWQSANGWFIRNFYATLAALVVNGAVSLVLYFSGNYHIITGIWALAAGFFTLFLVAIIQFGKKNAGVNSLLSLPGRSEITEFAGK
jgi:O-antigen/teichoic acid export membrane protein